MGQLTPTPKTTAALSAGAITTLVLWILGFWHITMTAEQGAALTTVFSFAAQFFAPRSAPTPEQKAEIILEHSTKTDA